MSAASVAGASSPAPPTTAPIRGLDFLVEWTEPRALGALSTVGWEDSAFVAADGAVFYFGYSPLDYASLLEGEILVVGPDRPGQAGIGFDIWEATIDGDAWRLEHSSVNSDVPELHEAAIGVDLDRSTIAFASFDPNGDLHIAERRSDGEWGQPQRLPAPINTPCIEDNPHLSADGATIFFDSDRIDAAASGCSESTRDFWVTHRDGDGWTDPVRFDGPPDATAVRWQIFVTADENEVYWTGWSNDCGAANCIYRAVRGEAGQWGEREIVVRPTAPEELDPGEAWAIGEISFTADRKWFYFVWIHDDAQGRAQVDLGVARHLRRDERRGLPSVSPRAR